MIFLKNPNFIILKIKNHKIKKEKILKLASSYSNFWIGDSNDYISNTDWMNNSINWIDILFDEKDKVKYSNYVCSKYKKNKLYIDNSWFNQYEKNSGSNHSWHNHPNCSLTNIYFVELCDKSLRTQLIDPETKKIIIPRVNEGDLLVFSSDIIHRSPPNYTKTRKTIISFNSSFL